MSEQKMFLTRVLRVDFGAYLPIFCPQYQIGYRWFDFIGMNRITHNLHVVTFDTLEKADAFLDGPTSIYYPDKTSYFTSTVVMKNRELCYPDLSPKDMQLSVRPPLDEKSEGATS